MTAHVVGIDLSLRAAAACAIPIGWDAKNLDVLRFEIFGEPLGAEADAALRARRLSRIATDLLAFCAEWGAQEAVWLEDYAFARGRQAHARSLAEAGGALKAKLFENGHVVRPVVASHARKVLLGRLPRKDVKDYVVQNVRRLGGPTAEWSADMIDAFVVANYGAMRAGGVAMTFEGNAVGEIRWKRR